MHHRVIPRTFVRRKDTLMDHNDDDDRAIEVMEIDLEVAHIGEILERHGVPPTADLVSELWHYAELLRSKATS